MRSEIYAVGIGIDPGVSYAGGNLNTESAWSTSKATPPAPELTGRFVPSTWTALDEGFFLLGEDNADNEEQRLIDWCDEFAARYPADLDIDPHLGCWRIVTHGLLSYRESEFGKALSEVPFIASDVFYSDYCGVITELMNVDGQAAPYFAEIAAGVAM